LALPVRGQPEYDVRDCLEAVPSLRQVQTHPPTRMTEQSEAITPPEPSPQLFELLQFLEDSYDDLCDVMLVEFQHEELYGLGELTDLQVDKLLTRGCI
jgi:hypothetical protein